MFRGLIRETRAFSAKDQENILMAAGVPKRAIYTDDLVGAIKSLRQGERLVVAGLRALGRNPSEINNAVDAVHGRGAVVMDAASKRTTAGKHRYTLMLETAKALANERRGPRKRTKKDRRMPWDRVAKYYFEPTISNAELEAIVAKGFSPMSYDTMRRHFGKKRGAITGRPSASRAATVL
jgi:hypothetical protein